MPGTTPPPVSGAVVAPLRPDDPRELGPYRVAGRLGQGGMGAVFLASRPDASGQDGQWVAIKVIRPDLAEHPEFRARFRREAESARKVKRFATAAVLDADPDGPQPYLVTEYVEGPTLSRMVSARGPLRPADLEHLALSVATALSAIHNAGIIHRDLTPANVLLSPVGPKVIDFGLARSASILTNISHVGAQPIGTPAYMAPEQILDEGVTSAVDVFAWGSVVIFAGTGHPAWGEGPTEVILYRIIHDEPRLLGIPDDLRELVARAMRKDPAERPSADALRAVLTGSLDPASLGGPGTTRRSTGRLRKGSAGGGRSRRRLALPQRDSAPADSGGTVGLVPSVPPVPPRPVSVSPVPVSPYPAVSPAPAGSMPAGSMPARRMAAPVTPAPRRRRLGRRGLVLLSCLTAAVATASVLAVTTAGRNSGPTGVDRAAVSRQLAGNADTQRQRDPELAGQLAVAAYRIAPTTQARRAMVASFVASSAVSLPQRGATVIDVAWDARGRTLAEVDTDGRVRLWDLSDRGRPTLAAELSPAVTGPASGVALSADSRSLAVGGGDNTARLWADRTWETGGTGGTGGTGATGGVSRLDGHISPVVRLVFDTSGRLLVTVGADGTVGLWDISDPRHPTSLTFLTNRSGLVTDIALRPDGRLLATAAVNETVRLWDLTDPAQPHQVATMTGHVGAVVTVAFSQDGRAAVTGGDDHTVRLWDLTDPGKPRATGILSAHDDRVTGAAFGADGLLVSAGADGAIVFWDATAKPVELTRLVDRNKAVSRLAVSGDGYAFAAGGSNGDLRVLSTDPDTLARTACADPHFRLSRERWTQWAPQVPYSDPCPR
ncbi:serine/threonine-protein kinase [Frankia sp. Cas3]|uniref:WD40 repeat domain-containing serine/threonine protein kinase n=2 Tax=unclassified Frankia TaxID=2632575 RepID=UPI002AD31A01|nr:serine/threonine-protein kinase [Frankia sp. Cas3]